MSSTPLRLGFNLVGQGRGLLAPKFGVFEIRHATISGRAMRTEEYVKPKPWPYKEKGYNNFHASVMDGTTKRLNENSKVIVVEGLPCIGKTEVAKTLAQELDMKHFPMVTMDDYYINSYGYDTRKMDPKLPHNLKSFDIDGFIKNPKDDRSPILQFRLYFMKFFRYVDALAHLLNTGEGVVLESSVYSDLAFLEAMCALDYINRAERKGYYQWRDKTIPELMKPHLVVYLDASPATVEENLKRRGKGEEKTFNKDFLEKLDNNYKHQFLQTISEHAEVLIYDWNTPGESEIIVEDIERIDFDKFEDLDPKMGDWRLKEDWDWSENRWRYTNGLQRQILACAMVHNYLFGCPRLYMSGEDSKIYQSVLKETPGEKFAPGFNTDMGDSILLKTSPPIFKKYALEAASK